MVYMERFKFSLRRPHLSNKAMDYALVAYMTVLLVCSWLTESSANCTVYDLNGQNRKTVFECNTPVVLSCKVPAGTGFIQWFIAESFGIPPTSSVAYCLQSSCTASNNFTGRYNYTYNEVDGIANITITNVTMDDGDLKYRCDDGTTPPLFEPTIKVFPDNATTNVSYSISQGLQSITLTTGCTILKENITFLWKKTNNSDGTELTPLTQNDVQHTETTETNGCASTNTCGKLSFSNTLRFKLGNTGDRFYIHCSIIVNDEFGPAVITRISSQAYQFKDITTDKTTVTTIILPSQTAVTASSVAKSSTSETKTTTTTSNANANTSSTTILPTTTTNTTTIPTTSTSSLPSSSIAIFTTSSSTGPGKEQNQNTDKTSTILIIAFSSLCGIALLLIVVFAINKIRKRYKKQSGASNDHEM